MTRVRWPITLFDLVETMVVISWSKEYSPKWLRVYLLPAICAHAVAIFGHLRLRVCC